MSLVISNQCREFRIIAPFILNDYISKIQYHNLVLHSASQTALGNFNILYFEIALGNFHILSFWIHIYIAMGMVRAKCVNALIKYMACRWKGYIRELWKNMSNNFETSNKHTM